MSITLPLETLKRCKYRVLTRETFGSTDAAPETSGGGWTIQPMDDGQTNGLYMLRIERVGLPLLGKATFRYRYGKIDGRFYGNTSQTNLPWDPATSTLAAPDLRFHEIRIQAALPDANDVVTGWRTVWWGQCVQMQDRGWPAAKVPSGERTYICYDGANRLRYQRCRYVRMTPQNSEYYLNQPTHPGYNAPGPSSQILGNKYTGNNNVGDTGFSYPGSSFAEAWTDKSAINHALCLDRASGTPLFQLYGGTGTSGDATDAANANVHCWPIQPADSVLDFLGRIIRPQRGIGIIYVDWSDNGDPTGPLTVWLSVKSQLQSSVIWHPTTGDQITVGGATENGTSFNIDLIGDHRASPSQGAGRLDIDEFAQANIDKLEIIGERIQVCATLTATPTSTATGANADGSEYGALSLSPVWNVAQAATFEATDPFIRKWEYFDEVYQRYRIWPGWKGKVSNGHSSDGVQIDYQLSDDDQGSIVTGVNPHPQDSSPSNLCALGVRVLPDTPLFVGYLYSGDSPARADGRSEIYTPGRRPPLVLIHSSNTAEDKFTDGDNPLYSLSVQISEDKLKIFRSGDVEEFGAYRTVSNLATTASFPLFPSSGGAASTSQLSITCGLELPSHLRMVKRRQNSSGVDLPDSQLVRRMTIERENLHLWLLAPNCIYELDRTSGYAPNVDPKRKLSDAWTPSSGSKAYYILRDDRNRMRSQLALAWQWYGQPRFTAAWSLACCGLLPSFSAMVGTATTVSDLGYARIGDFIARITAAGQNRTINTPITSIVVDCESEVTTWATDWTELEFMNQR